MINTYQLNKKFDKVSVNASVGSVEFVVSESDNCKVVSDESKKLKCSAAVENGTLIIKVYQIRKWYNLFGGSFKTPKITVYLPQKEYDSVNIETETAKVDLTDTMSKELNIKTTTGSIALENVKVSGALNIKTTTGSVEFYGSDAGEIFVKTTTGKVTGRLLSEKVFIVRTTTGKINVPKSITGGRCEITTTTGRVDISIK